MFRSYSLSTSNSNWRWQDFVKMKWCYVWCAYYVSPVQRETQQQSALKLHSRGQWRFRIRFWHFAAFYCCWLLLKNISFNSTYNNFENCIRITNIQNNTLHFIFSVSQQKFTLQFLWTYKLILNKIKKTQ